MTDTLLERRRNKKMYVNCSLVKTLKKNEMRCTLVERIPFGMVLFISAEELKQA